MEPDLCHYFDRLMHVEGFIQGTYSRSFPVFSQISSMGDFARDLNTPSRKSASWGPSLKQNC